MSTSDYSKTPTITTYDNRHLAVRTLEWCRHPDTPQTTEIRPTYCQYDARGFLSQSADPRLAAAGLNNFTCDYDLGGRVLRTCSADAGTSLALSDAAGRTVLGMSGLVVTASGSTDMSRAVTIRRQYEDRSLPGRLLSVVEQASGKTGRVTERLIWSESSAKASANNLVGTCIRHYDPSGCVEIGSIALSGLALSVTRWLMTDDEVQADWQGDDRRGWDAQLDDVPYATLSQGDAAGRVVGITDAVGNKQRMVLDIAGMSTGRRLTVNGEEKDIVRSTTRSAAGQVLQEEHGNGVVVNREYEPQTQWLKRIKTERPAGHPQGAGVLQDLRYEYDPVGNVKCVRNDAEETRFWRNQQVEPENRYGYDSLYQLVSASGREKVNIGQQNRSFFPADSISCTRYLRTYTYDSGNNLTRIRHSASGSGNCHTTYITVSDSSNRAVLRSLAATPAEVEMHFGPSGEQLQLQPGQALAWTVRGELLQVTPVEREGAQDDWEYYRYDARSQRVVKGSRRQTGSGTLTQRVVYLPGLELRTKSSGESLQTVVSDNVRLLHWESGKPEGLSNDGLRYSYENLTGSSGLEVDEDGCIISVEEYYPYGGTSVWSGSSETEADYKTVRYSGKEQDATGLYYYGYRYYQTWAGRWTSADPAGTADGLNMYRMCRNNPVTFRDSNGLLTEKEIQTLMFQTRQHMSQTGKDLESVMHNILGLNGDDAAVIRSRLGNTLPEPTASISGIHEITAFQEQIEAMSTSEVISPHIDLPSLMPENFRHPPSPGCCVELPSLTSSDTSDDDMSGVAGPEMSLPEITPELMTSHFPNMSEADRQALEYIANPENFSHTLYADGTVVSSSDERAPGRFTNNYKPDTWTFLYNFKLQEIDKGVNPYFASHVAQYQYLLAAVSGGWVGQMPSTLIRKNVINKDTIVNTAGLKGEQLMSAFLNNTPNGKSTAKILEAFNLNATSVKIKNTYAGINFYVKLKRK
ncbi:RHS repeat protein [Salmonella enterica]|nr:RHS repeat protein [Salmonella enterica]